MNKKIPFFIFLFVILYSMNIKNGGIYKMKEYESLIKLYYKHFDTEKEYRARIENPCAYITNLEISPILRGERVKDKKFPLFYLSLVKLNLLQQKISYNSKEILDLSSSLPSTANMACIRDIMMNEINKSNGIEGVHSTKKELYESMNTEKSTRFYGIVNKYFQIIENNIESISSPEEIRKMYDEIFKEDILKNPENQLDGILFRKEGIHVSDSKNSTIHTGDLSEEMIIEDIKTLIEFMNKDDIPSVIKGAIVHYYFEYIHPFYDGNGRFGRYLLSMYLARKIDTYTGLSLSYAIFEDKKKYSELFLNTSNVKNYGEITFFIEGMLEFIVKGQESIIKMLKEKILKLDYANFYTGKLEDIEGKQKNILYIYIQNYIFSKNNPLSDNELLTHVRDIKSLITLKRHLKKLTELGYITQISKKPVVRTISDKVKEILP